MKRSVLDPRRAARRSGCAGRRPAGSRRQGARALLALACATVAAVAATTSAAAAAAAAATRSFSVYAVATNEVYVNNTDSLTLGVGNNPFGRPTGASATIGSESTNGPFPGDEGLYSFLLYSNKGLNAKIGSALYTCQYYFDKNGFCDATFQLNSGILIGAGIFNFNTRGYALAITGGEGNYAAASGDVEANPSGSQAQRLVFVLKQP